ncbi:MAG: hypothetical protein ACTIBG_04960 [Brevibacterium aurantiacum]|uniref:Uncharacterized protein n=1 Tax=Brevibacterium aurantiacum TaxID=273384 RepID=A0A3Q9NTM3_BREAU|nr:hypothetical protein [Brevibacterium aurantiacum]AZT94776.1 hypothetical protein CXR23_17875 [Brevibacterium aurantiacum]
MYKFELLQAELVADEGTDHPHASEHDGAEPHGARLATRQAPPLVGRSCSQVPVMPGPLRRPRPDHDDGVTPVDSASQIAIPAFDDRERPVEHRRPRARDALK